MKKKIYTLLEIEYQASISELSEEDFSTMFWRHLVVSKTNKAQLNQIARDLNIYPQPASVHLSLMQHLTGHIH